MDRPFLPPLQMSESETLISMVNRMVESSSPRAHLFMQVRPLPASTVLSMPSRLLVHDWVTPCGLRPASPNPFTRQAASPLKRILLDLLPSSAMTPPSFMFIDKLRVHFLNHQTANSDISCMLRITDLLLNAQDADFMLSMFLTDIPGAGA